MSHTVEYYFTPVSPWTYLGHTRFVALARQHQARVLVRPIDLGRVFGVSGGIPLAKRAPQRQAYRLVELARWRESTGLPLNLHPKHFPVPADLAARTIIAADLAQGTEAALDLAGALMRACWAEDRDVSAPDTVAAIVAEAGLPAAALAAQADAAQAAFERYTEEAMAHEVFGAPWYRIDGEPFWGQDRLEFVARALERP